MTWLGDNIDKIQGPEKEKLLSQRALLVEKIKLLKSTPLKSKTVSAQKFLQEDLISLAHAIVKIDEKLGRMPF